MLTTSLLLLFSLPLVSFAQSNSQWKFLKSYPRHLLVYRIPDNSITIDGRLNHKPWLDAIWYNTFYDITDHIKDPTLNNVPEYQQATVATFYDSNYLYVGSKLRDPFTTGDVKCSHNGPEVPYHDNDFEFFVDPSMSTEFYKEFEMNVNNATYDVNWGVPDQDGLTCDSSSNRSKPYLPTCVNTSSPFYSGSWTMGDPSGSGKFGGLKTATFAPYLDTLNKKATWNVEIAFPLRGGKYHGGLLDTDSKLASSIFYNFSRFDPTINRKDPLYWAADFARTVHPRKFIASNGSLVWCPFNNCSLSHISSAVNVSYGKPNSTECAALSKMDVTMLGSDPSYGCYFEWVLQNVGSTNNYMHRPLNWAYLEFKNSNEIDSKKCGNIEFPARHLLRALHDAQKYYYKQNKNSYATNVMDLIKNCSYCITSDINDLTFAIATPSIFQITINVDTNPVQLNETCTSTPCYLGIIKVIVPNTNGFQIIGQINENKRLVVERKKVEESDTVPCLF